MQSHLDRLVLIATGGTIAGRAASAHDNVGYTAGQVGVEELLQALPPGAGGDGGLAIEAEQLAQLDSKDMDHATWQRLAASVHAHLARPEVRGVVITHGTDTLEETAWLLQRVLAPAKPVVLTAAMRPASSLQADGPQNLADALAVAASPGAAGVVGVVAGLVLAAGELRKHHTWRLDAFDAGDAGPLARIEQGALRRFRDWPQGHGLDRARGQSPGPALGLDRLAPPAEAWPWVEIVHSHAGARAAGVDALVAAGVQGLVVAGTGNGTVHQALAAALDRAQAAGVALRVVTRCAAGPALAGAHSRWPVEPELRAPQARVELLLELLGKKTHEAGARTANS